VRYHNHFKAKLQIHINQLSLTLLILLTSSAVGCSCIIHWKNYHHW